jgi:ribosomal subunit interface protein
LFGFYDANALFNHIDRMVSDPQPEPDPNRRPDMRIAILCRGIPSTQAIRDYAQRRLKTALGRYRSVLASVQVRLADVNGPRGGVDKHCVVEVGGPAMAPIIVRERDADLYVAIDRAADRIDRATGRRLARLRAPPRGVRRQSSPATGADITGELYAGANLIPLRRIYR